MKTLIAALVLTVAASAPALAGDSVASDAGIAQVLQANAVQSNFQVSGFAVGGEFRPAMDTPREGGLALSLQEDYVNASTFGFTGIQAPSGHVIEHSGEFGNNR